MSKQTYHDEEQDSFPVSATADIPAFGLVKFAGAAITPLAAITDVPVGADNTGSVVTLSSATTSINLLNKCGTMKVVQEAAIVPGAEVTIGGTTFTSVRTVTGITGATIRILGIKVDRQGLGNGSAGDVIEIMPFPSYVKVIA